MYKVYFAGDMFDQKHITGNLLLAQNIAKLSENKFKCLLPQDWEGREWGTEVDIRNRDIKAIMESDFVLFNFDGTDVDSGTIVEFVIAKMLDVPSVILRTDCRNGGYLFGRDWNLMMSGFPRCALVKQPALKLYNDLGLEKTHQTIAQSIITAFESVAQEPSLLNSYEEMLFAYNHVIKTSGSGMDNVVAPSLLHEIITKKIEKQLYSMTHKDKIQRASLS